MFYRNRRNRTSRRIFSALAEQAAVALNEGSMFQFRVAGEIASLNVDRFVLEVEKRVGVPVRAGASASEGMVTIYRDDVEAVDSSVVVAEVVRTERV